MSDRPTTIIAALGEVMAHVRSVAKKDVNTHQRFNFRGIDSVMNAVGPALREFGVVVTPLTTTYTRGTVEVGADRRQMGHIVVDVTYRFYGPQGDYIDSQVIGEAFDSGDKAAAKAMSVAFRTCLLQALCLPTDEPDPDEVSYVRAPAPEVDPWATPDPQASEAAREAAIKRASNERGMTIVGGAAATKKQIGMIGALMAERNMTDHDQALAWVNQTIAPEGPVASRADLTKAQASKLITALNELPLPEPLGQVQD